jgi:hypothetical protein
MSNMRVPPLPRRYLESLSQLQIHSFELPKSRTYGMLSLMNTDASGGGSSRRGEERIDAI